MKWHMSSTAVCLLKNPEHRKVFSLMKNAYYIEITENEKIYDVENEAGKGFVNAAQTGSLRIEKTSSDGKLEALRSVLLVRMDTTRPL